MGTNASSSKFSPDEKTLILTSMNLSRVPYKFPSNNQLASLNLSRNRVQKLPRNLSHLIQLILSYNSMNEIPAKIVRSLISYTSLESLDLSHNNLTALPPDLKELQSLKRLNLFGNQISSIILPKALTNLDLGQNLFTSIPELPDSLQSLNMDFNQITSVNFTHPHLTRLCLSLNKIEAIAQASRFPTLFTLDISRNQLISIGNLSQICPRLRQFDASENRISSIEKLPRPITELYLKKNHLSAIPAQLATYSCLIHADFSYNQIEVIPKLPPGLQSLDVYDNRIRTIENSQLPELTRFYAMRNLLEEAPLLTATVLQEYFLVSNRIRRINPEVFSNNVTRIDVSDNELEEIPDEIFSLPSLTYLNLARNKIRNIGSAISKSSLILLNLSDNPIGKLPELPSTMEQLFAVNCAIESIEDLFEKNVELMEIDLAGNSLEKFPLIQSLKTLNLSQNRLKEFPAVPQTIRSVDISCNILESLPDPFELPELTYLDVSVNKLSAFPKVFEVPSLSTLKAQFNPLCGEISAAKLRELDVSGTNITLSGLSDTQKIISSTQQYSNRPPSSLTVTSPCVGYSQVKGARETSEDPIIVRSNPDFGLYGIIDASKSCYELAFELVEGPKQFDEASLAECIEKSASNLRESGSYGGSSIGICLIHGKEIIAAMTGSVKIILVDRSGMARQLINVSNTESQEEFIRSHYVGGFITGNRTYGPLGVSRSLGDFLVFGISGHPDIGRLSASPDDRFLLVLSAGVSDSLSLGYIGLMAQKSSSACELAHRIVNASYAGMATDNLSCVAVEIGPA